MIDPSLFPQSVQTILVTRLDGLGDIVLGTMLLSGLHRRWPGAYIKILVRPQMRNVPAILPKWLRVIPLPFDPREPVLNREQQLAEQIQAISEDCQADLTIIGEYNRVWAGELVAAMSNADLVVAFDGPSGMNVANRGVRDLLEMSPPDDWQLVHIESDSRETTKYAAMLAALGMEGSAFAPGGLAIRAEDQSIARTLWTQMGIAPEQSIVVFPGCGDGISRTLPPAVWKQWIEHLCQSFPVLLLGSELDAPVVDAVASAGLPAQARRLLLPAQHTGVMGAILESAAAYIGMDTGPMHVSAVLGRPTLGVYGGGHRAERFLPAGPRAAAIRMPITCYGCDWHCPFDSRLCLSHIPPQALIDAGDAFLATYLADAVNANPLSPRIFDVAAPAELPNVLLGPTMRQHRQFLIFNHDVLEHHDYLARVNQDRQGRISEMGDALGHITKILAEMTRQNRAQDEAISSINRVLAEMTRHNQARDQAIAHINATLAEMTQHNNARDNAISQIHAAVSQLLPRSEPVVTSVNER
jgi:ADP-heptose:LPS heptosyltransferase